ncbi:hypothetical protein M0802_000038 [Mischocyttarus mexicanus]|nr:hypothetical protein M0802_000038 [Mischocyttarus mexicanus]
MAPEKTNMSTNQLRNASSLFTSTSGIQPSFNTYSAPATNAPPPLPPRQSMGYNDCRPGYLNSYGGYGSMNNYYRGYNSYSPFGGYMGGFMNNSNYNNYGFMGGPSGDIESRFTQYAEESTRSTFQMLETVLQTFSSITMLLESSYFAITNCFKAILSVADSIGRLRSTISQLLSTFALIRFLKWIYKKITYKIGLRNGNLDEEELWQRSLVQAGGEENSTTIWSNFLFLGIFFIIPYLINKISSNVNKLKVKCTDPKEWTNFKEPVYVANVLYDFTATSNDELSLKTGQKIWLAPQPLQPKNMPGWWIATDSRNVGLIPSNYVNIVAQLKKKTEVKPPESSTSNISALSSTQNANEVEQNSLLDSGNNNNKNSNENVELLETCYKENKKIESPETSDKTDNSQKLLV